MSHFTKVKTRILDRAVLENTLADLNYRLAPGEQVSGWQGATRKADIVAKTRGPYDIGFIKTADGSFDIVADWWGLKTSIGLDRQTFVNQLGQRYAYNKVITEVKARGFAIAEEVTQPDKSIRVVVRRW